MSKASRTSHPHSIKSAKHAPAPSIEHHARRPRRPRRMVRDSGNSGPPRAAVHDRVDGALNLAARDVAKCVLFTAGLLAHLFEATLRLPTRPIDRIGFPAVPSAASAGWQGAAPPTASGSASGPLVPSRPVAQSPLCDRCGQFDPRFRVAV